MADEPTNETLDVRNAAADSAPADHAPISLIPPDQAVTAPDDKTGAGARAASPVSASESAGETAGAPSISSQQRGVRVSGSFLIGIEPDLGDKDDEKIKEIRITPLGGATDEEVQLYSDVASTETTLKSVFPDANPGSNELAILNDYLVKLFWIAKSGLQTPSEPKVAAVALRSLRADLLARQGSRIKNGYMKSLGVWAAQLAGGALAAFVVLRIAEVFAGWPAAAIAPFDGFLMLWIGAMVGCWLSFGIRNPQLTFEALGQPESDLLIPAVRLLFTGLLSITLGLVFFTGMVQVTIGGLATQSLFQADTLAAFALALMVGLFCGIGEQALTTTISNRTSQFLGEIGK